MPTEAKQARREQSHERILDAAARALCRDGYGGVGVAGVMKEAGLTHGGFYAHFASREALLAAAVKYAGARSIERMRARIAGAARGASPLRALVEGYLSEAHVHAAEEGCPVAALASEMPRTAGDIRDESAGRVRDLVDTVARVLPADAPPGSATVIASTMIGAMQMARMFEGKARLDVLRNCREALLDRYDRAPSA